MNISIYVEDNEWVLHNLCIRTKRKTKVWSNTKTWISKGDKHLTYNPNLTSFSKNGYYQKINWTTPIQNLTYPKWLLGVATWSHWHKTFFFIFGKIHYPIQNTSQIHYHFLTKRIVNKMIHVSSPNWECKYELTKTKT